MECPFCKKYMVTTDRFTVTCLNHDVQVDVDYDHTLFIDVCENVFIEANKKDLVKLFINTFEVSLNKTYDELISTNLSDTIAECKIVALFN